MKDGICRASMAAIAEGTGLDTKTARRHAKALCEKGYLKDLTPDVRHKPHIYADTGKVRIQGLLEAQVVGGTESPTSGSPESPTRSGRESNKDTTKRHDSKRHNISPGEQMQTFDLRDDPLIEKEGAFCEKCGEKIPYLAGKCNDCGEEVTWIDRKGNKRADFPPRTNVMQDAFQVFGLKYFRTEQERDKWEKLEKEFGPEPIEAWVNWLREKSNNRRLGRRGLRGLWTCVTEIGEPKHGKHTRRSRESEDDRGGVPKAQSHWATLGEGEVY